MRSDASFVREYSQRPRFSRLRAATRKQRETFSRQSQQQYRHIQVVAPNIPNSVKGSNTFLESLYGNRSGGGAKGHYDSRGRGSAREKLTPYRRRTSRSLSPQARRPRTPIRDACYDYENDEYKYDLGDLRILHLNPGNDSDDDGDDWDDLNISGDFEEPGQSTLGSNRVRPRLRDEEAAYLKRMLLKFRMKKRSYRVQVRPARQQGNRDVSPARYSTASASNSKYRSASVRKSVTGSHADSIRSYKTDKFHQGDIAERSHRYDSSILSASQSRSISRNHTGDFHSHLESRPIVTRPLHVRPAPVPQFLKKAISVRNSRYRHIHGPALHVQRWLADRYTKPTEFFFGKPPKPEGISPSYKQDPNNPNKFLNVPRPKVRPSVGVKDTYFGKAYPDYLRSRERWLKKHSLSYPDNWKGPEEGGDVQMKDMDSVAIVEINSRSTTPRPAAVSANSKLANTAAWRETLIDAESVCGAEDFMTDADVESVFAVQDYDASVDSITDRLAATKTDTEDLLTNEASTPKQGPVTITPSTSPQCSIMDSAENTKLSQFTSLISLSTVLPAASQSAQNPPFAPPIAPSTVRTVSRTVIDLTDIPVIDLTDETDESNSTINVSDAAAVPIKIEEPEEVFIPLLAPINSDTSNSTSDPTDSAAFTTSTEPAPTTETPETAAEASSNTPPSRYVIPEEEWDDIWNAGWKFQF